MIHYAIFAKLRTISETFCTISEETHKKMTYLFDYKRIAEKMYDFEKTLYNPEKTWVDKIFLAFDFAVTLHRHYFGKNEIMFIKT